MAQMLFFTHSECEVEQQQKSTLVAAGHTLKCRDLRKEKWTREKLLPFVRGRSPVSIMNMQASAIRSGEIDPVLLIFEEALKLMVATPELIKGPLIAVDGLHLMGRDDSRLARYLSSEQKELNPGSQRRGKRAPSLQRIIWDYWQNIDQTANRSPA